ncbi:MAG: NUDIX domain-containing protein [Patescibacteria group bacterium]
MDTSIRRATVCFIRKDNKVLLAKIEDEYTYWNGIGGWAEIGETVEEGVAREIDEETFIKVETRDLKRVVEFGHLHVFLTDIFSGKVEIKEPLLKELKWFSYDEIPYLEMIKGTDKWLPGVLEGKLYKDGENGLVKVETL